MGCCASALLGKEPDRISGLPRGKSTTLYELEDSGRKESKDTTGTPAFRDKPPRNKILISTDKSALLQVLRMGVLLEEHLQKAGIRGKQILVSCVDVSAREPEGSKYYEYRWRLSKLRWMLESDVEAYVAIVTDRWLSKKATAMELSLLSEDKMLWQASTMAAQPYPVAVVSLALDGTPGNGGKDQAKGKTTVAEGGRAVGEALDKMAAAEKSAGYNHNLLVLSSITQKWVRQDKSKRELGIAGVNKFKDHRFVVAGRQTVNVDPLQRGVRGVEEKSDDPDMLARELMHHLLFTAFRKVNLQRRFLHAEGNAGDNWYRSENVRTALKAVDVDEAHSEPEEVLTSARARVVSFGEAKGSPASAGARGKAKDAGSPPNPPAGALPRTRSAPRGVGEPPLPRTNSAASMGSSSIDDPRRGAETVSEPSQSPRSRNGDKKEDGKGANSDGSSSPTESDDQVAVPANMPHLFLDFKQAKKRGPGNNSPRLSRRSSKSKDPGAGSSPVKPPGHDDTTVSSDPNAHSGTDAVLRRMTVEMETAEQRTQSKNSSGKGPAGEPGQDEIQPQPPPQSSPHQQSDANAMSLAIPTSKPAPLSSPSKLAPGDRLVVTGLEASPEYNGAFVKVLSVQSDSLVEVVVPTAGNERLFLPPSNLLPLRDPKAAFPALVSSPSARSRASGSSPRRSGSRALFPGGPEDELLSPGISAPRSFGASEEEDYFAESDSDIDIPEQLLSEAIRMENRYGGQADSLGRAFAGAAGMFPPEGGVGTMFSSTGGAGAGGRTGSGDNMLEKTLEDFLPPIYCPVDLDKLARQLPTFFGTPKAGGTSVDRDEVSENPAHQVQPPGMPTLPKKPPAAAADSHGSKANQHQRSGTSPTDGDADDDPGLSDLDATLNIGPEDPDVGDLDLLPSSGLNRPAGERRIGGGQELPRELIQANLDDTRMKRGRAAAAGGIGAARYAKRVGVAEEGQDTQVFAATVDHENSGTFSEGRTSGTYGNKSLRAGGSTTGGVGSATEEPTNSGLPSLAKMQTSEHAKRPAPYPMSAPGTESGRLDMSRVVLLSDVVGNGLVGLLGDCTIDEEDDEAGGTAELRGAAGKITEEADEDPDIGDLKHFSREEQKRNRDEALQTNDALFRPLGVGARGGGTAVAIVAGPAQAQQESPAPGTGEKAAAAGAGPPSGAGAPGPRLLSPGSEANEQSRSSSKSNSFTPPKHPAGVRPPSLGRPGNHADGSSRVGSKSSSASRRSLSPAPANRTNHPYALDLHDAVDPRAQFLESLVGVVVRPAVRNMSADDHVFPSSVLEQQAGGAPPQQDSTSRGSSKEAGGSAVEIPHDTSSTSLVEKEKSGEIVKYDAHVDHRQVKIARHFYSAFVDGSVTRELPRSFRGARHHWHRLAELRGSYLNKGVVALDLVPAYMANRKLAQQPSADDDVQSAGEQAEDEFRALLSGDRMVCWAFDVREPGASSREAVRKLANGLAETYASLRSSLTRTRANELAAYFGADLAVYGGSLHPRSGVIYLYSEYVDGGTVADRIALKKLANRKDLMRAELLGGGQNPQHALSKEDGTTQDLLQLNGGLEEEEAHFILRNVMRGLEQLHACGICYVGTRCHGALRCANVGINRKTGRVQLLDWGLWELRSRCNDERKTWLTKWCRWTAPETLVEGGRMTPKSDVWALGCLLLEMVTGVPPYSGVVAIARRSDFEVRQWLLSGAQVPPAPPLSAPLTAEWREFCGLCLTHAVEARPDPSSDAFRSHAYRRADLFDKRYGAAPAAPAVATGTAPAPAAAQGRSSGPGEGPKRTVTVAGGRLPLDPRQWLEQRVQRAPGTDPQTQTASGSGTGTDRQLRGNTQAQPQPRPHPQPPPAGSNKDGFVLNRQVDPGFARPSSVHNVRNNPHRGARLPSQGVPKVLA